MRGDSIHVARPIWNDRAWVPLDSLLKKEASSRFGKDPSIVLSHSIIGVARFVGNAPCVARRACYPEMWQKSRVSQDHTHHEVEGVALYLNRFEEVLSFHEPGLAAVRERGKWFHIRPNGTPAYRARFNRAFGFYEGLAAVQDDVLWYHIRSDGHPGYAARFTWCGNFQEQRAVVIVPKESYAHILSDGRPAYRQRYRYAGDYRDGAAVVLEDSGLLLHLDRDGRELNGARFADLTPFHKGVAAAKDRLGWFHVNREGRELYSRRFQALEPFYNGRARAVTHDGEILTIDEQGRTLRVILEARSS